MLPERRNLESRVTLTVTESARRYLHSLDSDTQALVLLYGIDKALGKTNWVPFMLPKRHLSRRDMKPFVTRLGPVSVVIPDAARATMLNGRKLHYHNGALSLD